VIVWTYDPKPPDAAYDVRSLPCKCLFESWLGRRMIMGYFGNVIALSLDSSDVDVILAHGDSLLLPFQDKPVVRVMHGSALGEALSARSPWRFASQLMIYVQELLSTLANRDCVAVSQSTLRHHPFVRRVIPHGVDTSVFYPEAASKTPEPSVLFVGALDGRKRGALLIDWFSRVVRARHAAATLTMVGPTGPDVAGVRYCAGVENSELAKLYRRAWVYASPSTYEGFGLPYLEAMASGTPVIAVPNLGSNEILDHGRFGRLVADSEFGFALSDLLADAERRVQLAARGLERASHYSIDAMVDRYESLLFATCRSRRRPAGNRSPFTAVPT
jgi:glycosyltransferase involved in cell wall biosynthesis